MKHMKHILSDRHAAPTGVTTCRLSGSATLERRDTERGIELRVLLHCPLESYLALSPEEAAYIQQYLLEKYSGVSDWEMLIQLAS